MSEIKLSAEALAEWKRLNPERFASLETVAKAYVQQKEKEKVALEVEKVRRDMQLDVGRAHIRTALTVTSFPDIDISGVRGIVAFRGWRFSNGYLRSTAMNSVWYDETMRADLVPTERNDHGIYGYELSPTGLLHIGGAYCDSENVCGLVEMSGEMVIHTDSVVRAEWARILCLFVLHAESAHEVVPSLHGAYPNVPFYVMNPCQFPELLFREVLRVRFHVVLGEMLRCP